MRIVVAELPRGGRQIPVDATVDWIVEAASEALEAVPSRLDGVLDFSFPARAMRVDVRCRIQAEADRGCDRCGESAGVVVGCDELLLYFRAGAAEEVSAEVELDAEDLEVGWYEDGVIDAASVLREALTLAMPSRVLCENAEDCERRTVELLARAHEGQPVGHPAFAVLGELK